MGRIWIAVAFSLVASNVLFACKCVPPPPNTNTRLAWAEWRLGNSKIVFEGKVVSIELQGWPIKPEPGKTVTIAPGIRVTFSGVRQYRGEKRTEYTVRTGAGGGDCGYSFKRGESYLVDAWISDAGDLETGICSATVPLEDAGTMLRLLRAEQPTPDDVIDLRNEAETGTSVAGAESRICGKVTFPSGVPPRPLTVQILSTEDSFPTRADEIDTESDGAFCSSALDAGKYVVSALATGPGRQSYRLGSYFPGVRRRSEAKPVHVGTKGGVVHTDFPLIRESLYTVRGYLRGAPRSPVEEIQIMLMPPDMDSFELVEPSPLGPGGTFEMRAVPAGHYTAFATVENDDGSVTFVSSVSDVDVRANVDNLKLDYVPKVSSSK